MKVVHDNILVQIPEPKKKSGRVTFHQDDIEVKYEGTVVLHGEAIPQEIKEILEGNPFISYKEFYDGAKTTIEGVDYIVMKYTDILIIF